MVCREFWTLEDLAHDGGSEPAIGSRYEDGALRGSHVKRTAMQLDDAPQRKLILNAEVSDCYNTDVARVAYMLANCLTSCYVSSFKSVYPDCLFDARRCRNPTPWWGSLGGNQGTVKGFTACTRSEKNGNPTTLCHGTKSTMICQLSNS